MGIVLIIWAIMFPVAAITANTGGLIVWAFLTFFLMFHPGYATKLTSTEEEE